MNTELLKYYKDMQNAYESANKGYNEEIKVAEGNLNEKIFELLENAKSNLEQTRLGDKYGFKIKICDCLVFYPCNPFDSGKYSISVERAYRYETVIALKKNGGRYVSSCDTGKLLTHFDEIKEALTVGVENAIRKDMESMLKEITEKQNKLDKLNQSVA
jgi:hypothetical protein